MAEKNSETEEKKEMPAEAAYEENTAAADAAEEDTQQQEDLKTGGGEEKGSEKAEDARDEKKHKSKGKEKSSEKLKILEAEKAEYLDALKRERADFENYKKRNATLAASSFQNGVADTVMVMLPILDNFERALAAPCEDQAFADGVDMIMRQLKDALKNLGVEEIEAEGAFDPEFHNAVMQVEEEGYEPNQIVEVLQKGYSLNEKVLRFAMVKVAK